MDQSHPLNVAELLEHCIAYLDSPRDLKVCALVSPLWVYPAQSHLFRAPKFTNLFSSTPEISWARFLETLESSPGLVQHIRHLDIELSPDAIATLSWICSSQFTHLETVVVLFRRALPPAAVTALQQLLGLPSLRRVKLQCTFSDQEHFTRLWDRCSPGIRHVALVCDSEERSLTTDSPNQITYLAPRDTHSIALESLYMLSTQMLDYRLLQNSCPFDLSKLKVLSIGWRARVPWQYFAPAVQSIEALDIVVNRTAASLVLSSFPKLTFLRIYLPHWIPSTQRLSMADQLFSGISPANVLRKIVVSADGGTLSMDSALCTQLDSQLSSLPMPHTPTVDLEVDQDSYEGISPYFPRLTSTNALRRTDSHGIAYWW